MSQVEVRDLIRRLHEAQQQMTNEVLDNADPFLSHTVGSRLDLL